MVVQAMCFGVKWIWHQCCLNHCYAIGIGSLASQSLPVPSKEAGETPTIRGWWETQGDDHTKCATQQQEQLTTSTDLSLGLYTGKALHAVGPPGERCPKTGGNFSRLLASHYHKEVQEQWKAHLF